MRTGSVAVDSNPPSSNGYLLRAADQPRSPPDEVSQGKRRHPQPERWRDRQEVAAGVGSRAGARTTRRCALCTPRASRRLWREIQTQGFAYSLTTVQRFVNQLRREGPPPAGRPRTALTQPQGPPPRQVAALILRRPERRTDRAARLSQAPGCPGSPHRHRGRSGRRLPRHAAATGGRAVADLAGAAEASGIGELERFARKLREDHDAVQAGLTLRYSNGQTEGQVTRLKLVKRQGYGRAKFDLLRTRVLRAA